MPLMVAKSLLRYDAKLFGIEEIVVTSRSEEHTSELQSRLHLVCRLLLEKKIEDQRLNDFLTAKILKPLLPNSRSEVFSDNFFRLVELNLPNIIRGVNLNQNHYYAEQHAS